MFFGKDLKVIQICLSLSQMLIKMVHQMSDLKIVLATKDYILSGCLNIICVFAESLFF